jgi:putative glycosyltransferase (TIGR04372 family)
MISKNMIVKFKKFKWILEGKIQGLLLLLAPLLIYFLNSTKYTRKIKFCPLISLRIGHLAANTELFLRRLKAGELKHGTKYIGVAGKTCNNHLLKMYKREMPIVKSRLLRGIITTSLFQKSDFFQDVPYTSTEYPIFNDLPKAAGFTPNEEKKGIQELEKMGISVQDWFVCFHNRDSEYLNRQTPYINWGYHDYRNCKISNFIPAMEYITSLEGYAIRVGHYMQERLKVKNNTRIIDYASNFRSDFMDIYLSAHCKFFVGTTAGLILVPTIFNKPVIQTNIPNIEFVPPRKGDLYISKKIKDIKKGRFLTFKEIFDRGISSWYSADKFNKEGLEVIENNPDEILDVVVEINSILDGRYEYTEEDEFLQKKYSSLMKPHHKCYGAPSRIGSKFLLKNRFLLE